MSLPSATDSARSLVLGFAAGLPPQAIAPFARSLRATGFAGQLGLVLAGYADGELAEMEALADFTVEVDARYVAPRPGWLLDRLRWLRATPGWRKLYPLAFRIWASAAAERATQARWEALEFACEGLQSLRYRHYWEVLHGPGRWAEQILLIDLRDVLFQADPFARPVPELEFALEDAALALDTQPNNRRWLRDLYGRAELTAVRGLPVSCSGSTIGRRDGILRYLAEMQREIGWRRQPLGSHDQGVHNHLLRRGAFGDAVVVANGHGRILTMGEMGDVSERADGVVVNTDGSVPEVLHQYDRDGARAARLLARLG